MEFTDLANNQGQLIRQICCFEEHPHIQPKNPFRRKSNSQASLEPLTPEWVIRPGSRAIGISDWEGIGYKRVLAELSKWLDPNASSSMRSIQKLESSVPASSEMDLVKHSSSHLQVAVREALKD